MGPVALVTAHAARALDEDLAPLTAALADRGIDTDVAVWDDAAVDWSAFTLAIVRSTWDYVLRRDEFLDWADRVGQQTRLANPPDVLRWNTDKRYLVELADRGLPVTPTVVFDVGQPLGLDRIPDDEVVVKPTIGAGSMDTERYGPDRRDAALAHVGRLLDAGRAALVQPYQHAIDHDGETGCIFIAGEFSHAIRKQAMLARGLEPGVVEGMYRAEEIASRQPDDDVLALAREALAAANDAIGGGPFLYARVDVVRSEAGSPLLLELELTEPSLFVPFADEAADRFAAAVAGLLAS